jgi:hypothetical protein
MKPLHFLALLLPLAAILSSCSPTRYVAASDENGMGYFDSPVDPTTYIVSFHGNSNTSIGTVERYSLFRAAELARARGFDYFIITETRNTEKDQTTQTYNHQKDIKTTTEPPSKEGNRNSGDQEKKTTITTTNSVSTDVKTEFTVARTVRLYKGTLPQGDPNAYLAQDILQTMAPYIQRN